MDLRELFKILRTRWLIVVILFLIGAGAGFGVAEISPKKYNSTATLFVAVNAEPSTQTGTLSQLSQYLLQRVVSYTKIVDSPSVLQPVINDLHLNRTTSSLAGEITTTNPTNTVLLLITATDSNPQQAARIATGVARQLSLTIARLEAVRGKSPVKATLTQEGGVPSAPSSPKRSVDIAIGVLLGLILGLLAAIARERSDGSIRSASKLQDIMGATPLGVVRRNRRLRRDPPNALTDPKQLPDSYRAIRDRLHLVRLDAVPRRVVVTSPLSGEGRTLLACNLAVAYAQTGARVCLVEADMRRPSLAGVVNDGVRGLSDVLAGLVDFNDVVHHLATETVDVLTAGTIPPDPGELLGSEQMQRLMTELSRNYDYLVIDTPPVLPVTDAAVIARYADGVILVARFGRTRANYVTQSLTLLDEAGIPVLGTVLTAAPKGTPGTYQYRNEKSAARTDQRAARHADRATADPARGDVAASTSEPADTDDSDDHGPATEPISRASGRGV